jgi:hypothetical protein
MAMHNLNKAYTKGTHKGCPYKNPDHKNQIRNKLHITFQNKKMSVFEVFLSFVIKSNMFQDIIMKYIILILTFISISHAGVSASENQAHQIEGQAVISRVIKAYGGEKVINEINSIYAKGNIKALMRGDEGNYIRYFKRSRKLRVETLYSRSSEIRILNGKKGWRSTNNMPAPQVTDVRYLAMAYQYKQLDLPYGLLKKSYVVRGAGEEPLNNKSVHVLELFDGEGPPLKVYIDPDTFYIIKVTGLLKAGNVSTTLSAEFSDFRIMHGMPLPHKIANYAGGHKVGETVIEEYAVNVLMDDSLFRP